MRAYNSASFRAKIIKEQSLRQDVEETANGTVSLASFSGLFRRVYAPAAPVIYSPPPPPVKHSHLTSFFMFCPDDGTVQTFRPDQTIGRFRYQMLADRDAYRVILVATGQAVDIDREAMKRLLYQGFFGKTI